jgi:hypothetical protein
MTQSPDVLHGAIMNIPARLPRECTNLSARFAYKMGHRDARHAAAELALAASPASPAADRAELAAEAKRLVHELATGVLPSALSSIRAVNAAIDALARSTDAPSEPVGLWQRLESLATEENNAVGAHFQEGGDTDNAPEVPEWAQLVIQLATPPVTGALPSGIYATLATPPAASTSAPEAGTMEDFGEAATLVSAVKAATTNGEALGLVLAYRKRVRALAATTPAPACRAEPATDARAEAASDKRRLDYLQRTGSTVEILPGSSSSEWQFGVGGLRRAVAPSIRDAIDRADRAAATDGGKQA